MNIELEDFRENEELFNQLVQLKNAYMGGLVKFDDVVEIEVEVPEEKVLQEE